MDLITADSLCVIWRYDLDHSMQCPMFQFSAWVCGMVLYGLFYQKWQTIIIWGSDFSIIHNIEENHYKHVPVIFLHCKIVYSIKIYKYWHCYTYLSCICIGRKAFSAIFLFTGLDGGFEWSCPFLPVFVMWSDPICWS